MLGGRDLSAGGAWLAVGRGGRFAAVTNFRDPRHARVAPRSRGLLVRDFLLGDLSPERYLQRLEPEGAQFQGFNLLLGDREEILHYSNVSGLTTRLGPGLHGVSNHLLNTPWPKVERTKAALLRSLERPAAERAQCLFLALHDGQAAADEDLPDTGIGRERERQLSAPFVSGAEYGTRCSSLLFVDALGRVQLLERRFGPWGKPEGQFRGRLEAKD